MEKKEIIESCNAASKAFGELCERMALVASVCRNVSENVIRKAKDGSLDAETIDAAICTLKSAKLTYKNALDAIEELNDMVEAIGSAK